MNRETWYGAYDHRWQAGDITSKSFSHPAKMARGLVLRIVREGIERGWWSRDTVILDPFGGVGTTGIACAAAGMRSILVELEPRFVRMSAGYDCPGVKKWEWVRWHAKGRQARNPAFCQTCLTVKVAEQGIIPSRAAHRYGGNFDLHAAAWRQLGLPHPVIRQGDSRELVRIVREVIGGGITSPPYGDIDANQLPRSPDGKDGGMVAMFNRGLGWQDKNPSYGTTPGQIGRMGGVTSPPYANRVDDSGTGPVAEKNGRYGETDGQIGNLRIGGFTSPPFSPAGNQPVIGQGTRSELAKDGRSPDDAQQGVTPGNLAALPIGGVTGNTVGDTYWSACATIYQQMYDLFQPGGHFALVVKAFVKGGKIVPLPQMTLDLLLSQGWEPVVWINASLVAEATQGSMMEEVPNYQKQRKSFFRRLSESKGSPEINEEIVIVVRKGVTHAAQELS